MAYNNSGELPIGQSYQLGEYVFSITVSHDPGESETGINVRCDKGGERARVASEVTGTVESWSVEANETEASVYVKVRNTGDWTADDNFVVSSAGTYLGSSNERKFYKSYDGKAVAVYRTGGLDNWYGPVLISTERNATLYSQGASMYTFEYQGLTWYLNTGYHYAKPSTWDTPLPTIGTPSSSVKEQFTQIMAMANVEVSADERQQLVARFAIDIREAGGGPGGDWDEPGDTGDPSYTLNVNVTGASAGTHDAAAVPMAPADQPVYGSGGAGGNGGGGGGGQSTAIVRRFATDKAGSVNQEVTLRPPGVGSKGSPGGKGGDGCILIFH